jgi:putative peptidoglycan lipid II flippase
VRPRIRLTLSPTIRRVLKLYLPVAAGLIVSVAGQIVDLNYKASLGKDVITWMTTATTLVQFPIGIAVAALSFAILPSISSDAAFERPDQFKETLATGVKLVLFLTVPAAIGFLAVGTPIVRLILEHHRFHSHDTIYTVKALAGYSLQIPFVGIDQLLIFAFYARKNTVTPMIIGVLGVLLYVVLGYILKAHLNIFGLALANTIQNSTHGMVLLVLLIATIGPFGGRSILRSIGTTLLAGAVMGMLTALATEAVSSQVGVGSLSAKIFTVGVALLVAGVSYLGCAALLRSDELSFVLRLARSRFAT